jgi:hypothetical protein
MDLFTRVSETPLKRWALIRSDEGYPKILRENSEMAKQNDD